ncbi:unnamed protein product [Camellia sinensis]
MRSFSRPILSISQLGITENLLLNTFSVILRLIQRLIQTPLNLFTTESALAKNYRSYGARYRRKWVLSKGHSSVDRELQLLGVFLKKDSRNFHAWNYRRGRFGFVAALKIRSDEEELHFTTDLINENFSNYSSCHNCSCNSVSFTGEKGSRIFLKGESSYLVHQALFTDPDDQSGWFYHLLLLEQTVKVENPLLVSTWPPHGSNLNVSADGFLDTCASSPVTVEGLQVMQLLSCLNLSNNKMGSFSALEPLTLLKSLKVLDISYNEIGAHVVDTRSYTKEALAVNAKLLEANPEYLTAWNYRKFAVEHILSHSEIDTEIDPDSIKSIYSEELRVTESALAKNYRSYGARYHRKWVLSKGQSSVDRELQLLGVFLKKDSRNFHAWNYRRFVAALRIRSDEEELHFTTDLINENFSNYSSWHNCSVILSHLLEKRAQGSFSKEKVLTEEYDFVHQALFTDPDDQSGWLYHLWLLEQTVKVENPLLVSTWPPHVEGVSSSTITFPSLGGLQAMQLLSCLNLSNNKMGSFSALEPLTLLKSLKVLDISYNEIGAHAVDTRSGVNVTNY